MQAGIQSFPISNQQPLNFLRDSIQANVKTARVDRVPSKSPISPYLTLKR